MGPRAIAMNPQSNRTHFVNESGTGLKMQKPRVRGRFTADRRKEVQQVRRQGACIRCRMLKKPCSGETPCSTCRGVESARLWKHPCIRTRIAEEFPLYSAGLHSTLSFHDINNVKSQINFQPLSGKVHISADSDKFPTLVCHGLRGNPMVSPAGTGRIDRLFATQMEIPTELLLIDTEQDQLSGDIGKWIQDSNASIRAREPSSFMKQTITFAVQLGEKKSDLLLQRVCDLWTATNMLTDTLLRWQINIANAAIVNPHPKENADPHMSLSGNIKSTAITETNDPYSFALILSQLRAAVEKFAGSHSKLIMNDIEKRLLQRQNSGRFETFLGSLIFLNCAERLCWLFLTWDTATDQDHQSRWPLDKQPRPYADQGDRFADILNMLLRMRSLSPKCRPRADGGVLEAVDDEDGLATAWLNQIAITRSFLDLGAATRFDATNSRSMDGKLFARVLQPQTVYT